MLTIGYTITRQHTEVCYCSRKTEANKGLKAHVWNILEEQLDPIAVQMLLEQSGRNDSKVI